VPQVVIAGLVRVAEHMVGLAIIVEGALTGFGAGLYLGPAAVR
jgi:hypothetical protein